MEVHLVDLAGFIASKVVEGCTFVYTCNRPSVVISQSSSHFMRSLVTRF